MEDWTLEFLDGEKHSGFSHDYEPMPRVIHKFGWGYRIDRINSSLTLVRSPGGDILALIYAVEKQTPPDHASRESIKDRFGIMDID